MKLRNILFKITKFFLGILRNRYSKYLLEYRMIFSYLKILKIWLIFKIMISLINSKEKTKKSSFLKLLFKKSKIKLFQAKNNISLIMTKIYNISLSNKIWWKWMSFKVKKELIMLSFNNKCLETMRIFKTSHRHQAL